MNKLNPNERLEELRKEHKELDDKLKNLTERRYLTPEEQLAVSRLKKVKLKLKEEIYQITNSFK